MKNLIVFAFIGLLAQLIDGSLGMAYGVTSTTLLLAFGVSPAIASASVHISEVVTTAASGISHIKFGNVDKKMIYRLIIPGSIGAFLGATFLSNLPGEIVAPYMSLFLLLLGVYVLIRFLFLYQASEERAGTRLSVKQSVPLGFIAGFFDATGGGGWGPITTPVLLSKKGISARKAVGTVDTSEFAIAVSASIGFLLALGSAGINWTWVIALMIGGVIAAPIAAWLVRIIPGQLMGVLVGGFIILTNSRTILSTWVENEAIYPFIYVFIALVWVISIVAAVVKLKHNKIIAKEKAS
ncbi:sulfite exporter TauE/SafE family protein [Oceanobacillus piezotolerans]|uniref:Probable membrane transporter protein n=1 Tax=Oceanobacillus piezotolerans TaxID=2448030 RepID=A0A498DA44_9BACI|nr:sulfite exporter TauE/SafE family protein [Oceanobacillus piezotolerans]RLL44890.1 sulfite exporter TauE/SafE family protein [Oceanobacillus piezotolerans]